MSRSGRKASQMSGSGREASWMSSSCQDSLPEIRELLGGPPGCPEVVGRPSSMSGSGWEALQISGRHSRLSGSDRETLLNVREALPDVQKNRKTPSDVRECSGGPSGC